MAGSSKEEIARQHAEALELLQLQPLPAGPPLVGEAIPLAHKTAPVADRVVVQDISTVTGPSYLLSLRNKEFNAQLPSQPQEEESSDDNENENETKANCREDAGSIKCDAPEIGKGHATSDEDQLLPTRALAPYWTYRGQVDVTPLQSLLQRGYNQPPTPLSPGKRYHEKDVRDVKNYWDPIHAAVRNVTIHRPSHDEWGIPKIVLVFCDDFVERVFELPWWNQNDSPFRKAIQPILDQLGVRSDRVVRLLLASLPPGTTIPIHFDSGEWVKSTHRVHVPVLVHEPDNILFRCGPDLQRIPTRPGYIVEINNQSWHAVSNCDSDYRVHLILDYVDDDSAKLPRQRFSLSKGEILRQTRRSVDRAIDAGKRPTPSFLILGAQKAGTTSLFETLMQHPWLVRPVKFRETHCLDWRWNGNLTKLEDQRKHVASFFETDALKHHPSCQTGDSTPSYLIDARRVIPRLQKVWSHWKDMKFLVMLREPIQRCESHYAMVTSPHGTPAQLKARGSEWRNCSLVEVLERDVALLKECGVIPYWQEDRVDRDIYDKFINTGAEYQAWQRYLSHIPTNTGSYALVGRSLYALNLLPWFRSMDRSQFFVVNLDDWSSNPHSILPQLWQHLEVPHCSTVQTEAQNTRSYESKLPVEWRHRLERFFAPHNERLVSLLADTQRPWQPCWSYNHQA